MFLFILLAVFMGLYVWRSQNDVPLLRPTSPPPSAPEPEQSNDPSSLFTEWLTRYDQNMTRLLEYMELRDRREEQCHMELKGLLLAIQAQLKARMEPWGSGMLENRLVVFRGAAEGRDDPEEGGEDRGLGGISLNISLFLALL